MKTNGNGQERTPRAVAAGPDKEKLLADHAGLPAVLYVWRTGFEELEDGELDNGVLLCGAELPSDEMTGTPIGVYRLERVGELQVTVELKR